MKRISIVGVGMSAATVTREGYEAIQQADVLVGAKRMLAMFAYLGKPVCDAYLPDDVAAAIESETASRFAVLVSGDTGFYSGAAGLVKRLNIYQPVILPGISSVSYFFAKCGMPWQEAKLISCHGQSSSIVDAVRRNHLTFALTGGNVDVLARRLVSAGFEELFATVGEDLGAADERIFKLTVGELACVPSGALAVLLVENPGFDARIRSGISDAEFLRGDVPMTKAEVRAVTMSKLALSPEAICCDIGCGTGSVTVEMALAAHQGHVYAIDKNPEAIALTEQNCAAFRIGNVTTIHGGAPEALAALPPLDAAFIGGSGGTMREIITEVLTRNPHARIAVNAVALETVTAALAAFSENHIEAEVVQVGVARTKPVAGLRMLSAQNPVFIISGGGHGR